MPFNRLTEIMEKLLGPKGCPWDKEQTRDSLKKYLIEELYELLEALDSDEPEKIREELGDLLFQILFHSYLSERSGEFDINDVINGIADKMIKRHPHVFGKKRFETPQDFMSFWDKHKKLEGKRRESVLDGAPDALPALLKASKLQKIASSVGFDWERVEDVFDKLDEELDELKTEIGNQNQKAIEDEMGDILFVLVRASNFVGVNPEDALRKAITKFTNRFRHMELTASDRGRRLSEMTLEEMETLWEDAKESFNKDKDS